MIPTGLPIHSRAQERERAAEAYEELHAREVERQRSEWLEQFGDDPRFPFRLDGDAAHKAVLQQMAE